MALDTLRSTRRQYRPLQARRLLGRATGICAALVVAAPLHALSCSPFRLPEALDEIVKSEHGYIAVTGKLTFDEEKLPKRDPVTMLGPDSTKITARITGKTLSRAGFKNDFSTDFTLEIRCLASWCAGAKNKSTALVFLKQSPSGYTLSLNPCGDYLFPDPSRADLNTVKRCYLAGNCPKANTF